MKKIYQQILDFPQMVNLKVFNAQLNTEVTQFDSQNGVRSWTKTVYQLLSIIVLITLEVGFIKGAMSYFAAPDTSALGKLGSILTTLVMVYSAFPIAHIIRSRGESLGGTHNGMVSYLFKDFVTTNIKLIGEVTAVAGFAAAVCFSLCFLFDTNLYCATSGDSFSAISGVVALPLQAFNTLLGALKLDYLSGVLTNFVGWKLGASQSFTGDMLWNINDVLLVGAAFVNVAFGLVVLYINLAVYHFVYTMVAHFLGWLQNPSLPLSVKHKNV
jgi:hypothetical protein